MVKLLVVKMTMAKMLTMKVPRTIHGVHRPLISLTFIFKEEALPLLVAVLL